VVPVQVVVAQLETPAFVSFESAIGPVTVCFADIPDGVQVWAVDPDWPTTHDVPSEFVMVIVP
jgi:hypothetical protein